MIEQHTTQTSPALPAGDNLNETSTQANGLSAASLTVLRAAGTPEAEIRALAEKVNRPKKAKAAKVDLPGIIERAKGDVSKLATGKDLWTARSVGQGLTRLGLYRHVRGFNAVGDALGHKGHNLPSLARNPKLYYLPSVGDTAAEKEVTQQMLNELDPHVIKHLTAEIEEIGGTQD